MKMNSYNDIKDQLAKVRQALNQNKKSISENNEIKNLYLINEDFESTGNITKKYDLAKTVEDEIDTEKKFDKDKFEQAYRISGGVLIIHGTKKNDIELTSDEKTVFQETMDEFVNEVSDLTNFGPLHLYSNNVEWSGKIVDFDMTFKFRLGESNGLYVTGDTIQVDENYLNTITKLQTYYEKFKSKWAKVIASRKKTSLKK